MLAKAVVDACVDIVLELKSQTYAIIIQPFRADVLILELLER